MLNSSFCKLVEISIDGHISCKLPCDNTTHTTLNKAYTCNVVCLYDGDKVCYGPFDDVSDAAIFVIKHINCYDKYKEIHPMSIRHNRSVIWIDWGDKRLNNKALIELIGKFD